MFIFTVLGFAAQACVICVSIALFVDMHSVVSAEHNVLVSAASLPQPDVVDDVDETDATLPIASSACAKVMTPTAIVTTISEFESYPDDINSMTVKQLKAYAKASGFTGYSALRKHELLALLSEF